jgi:hypothetical protein
MAAADVEKLVADMDRIGLAVMVNLSGGSGEALQQGLATLCAAIIRSALSHSRTSISRASTNRDSPRPRRSSSKST